MDSRVLKTLEYNKIIEQILPFASSSLGKSKVEKLVPYETIEEAVHGQKGTQEGYTIYRIKGSVPLGGLRDIRPSLKRLKIGADLNAAELLDIASTIQGGRRLKRFIEGLLEQLELSVVSEYAEQISDLKNIEDEILSCIDDHGEVMDSASATLRRLRTEIRSAEAGMRQKLEQMIRSTSVQKMLQEAIITIRNDRFVLPVKQEYRSAIGGVIHDQSASGATLYIEPEAIMSINNKVRELKLKEQQEVERILRELSQHVSAEVEPLEINVDSLIELDFIFAKANYAHSIKATEPKLNDEGYVLLKRAKHPLINKDDVVPINVELGKHYTSLVITGPNTGGKTVTLKTIGLLSLMAMSGLHIPADEGSEAAFFTHIFADIGDEQSIEQSLSTFSSHMTNIVRILNQLDSGSLVLFDELGAGTDPTEGAALAIAILEYVKKRGARIVATTHYSELKVYAYNRTDVMNASVEFDVTTLRPTYRLLVGVPGKSNAFAISERLGLPKKIIEAAKGEISEEDQSLERMISNLESSRKQAEQEHKLAEEMRAEIEQLKSELQRKNDQFEEEKNERMKKAEEEAAEAVRKAREEADAIITELRQFSKEEQAGIKEHRLIDARKRLEEAVPQLSKKKPAAPKKKAPASQQIQIGDEVNLLNLGQKGHIVEKVGKDEYQVQVGIMKLKVKTQDMEVLRPVKEKPRQEFTKVNRSNDENVRYELDLRGANIEEAILDIDKYLDRALLSGFHQVHLIHGKGTGALRTGVHEFLRRHKHVKSFRLGSHGEGSTGVTVVELK